MSLKSIASLLLFSLLSSSLFAGDGILDFIKNKNQFPEEARYKADLPGGAVFLTNHGFRYNYFKAADLETIHERMHENKDVENQTVHFHAYEVSFENANKNVQLIEEGLQPYYNNYFIGNDTQKWAGHVPLYKKVTWHNIYSNIDAVVYSRGSSLKYDFVVQPNANVNQIVLDYKGVTPTINADGSLLIKTSVNTLTEQAPYAYQVINGKEVAVGCKFICSNDNKVTFGFPKGYNEKYALIIDPELIFSTFSGSTATTYGFSATYDLSGCLYAGGECFNVGWPVSLGGYQSSFGGSVDAGINKYSSNGTTRIYATYYGGQLSDLPNNMMVNTNGELIICGSTTSSNLPMTAGCFDNTYNGSTDIYIARFSADGTQLKAATYLGGTGADGANTTILSPNYGDANRGEVLSAGDGHIIIANSSSSTDFPVTSNAYQATNAGLQDAIVSELDSNLSALVYSTYIGGSSYDAAFSLVLNTSNQIVFCGGTSSTNFPVTAGSYKSVKPGGTDGFVSILSPVSGLLYSTYLGTTGYDHAFKVQIDPSNNIFVLGQTETGSAYPVSAGAYSVTNGNIFIDKLNPTLSASLKSTRMGNASSSRFVPTAFLHDLCGNTYLSGFDASANSPLSANAYQTTPGSFWLGALSPDFTTLLYGTFFGPTGTHVDGGTSRFDPAGIVYHSACTVNPAFPTTPTAVYPVKLSSTWDIASYKFNMEVGAVEADFELANNANDTGCADYFLGMHNLSVGATNYNWNFGDGTTSSLTDPTHSFAEGTHTITLIATRNTGCLLADTASMDIYVKPSNKPLLHLNDTFICDPIPISVNANVSNPSPAFSYHWEPASAVISGVNQPYAILNPALSTEFTLLIDNSTIDDCVDTAMRTIHISLKDYSSMYALPLDTSICPGDTVLLRAYGGSKFFWSPNERLEDAYAAMTDAWPAAPQKYIVKITDDSACSIERTVNIKMLPAPHVLAGLDQDIKLTESAQLNGSAVGSYYWTPEGAVNPANILNPVVYPLVTTTYYLNVHSPEGCTARDSVTIHVTNAMLPNAFSPNGDGLNDVFKLHIQDERVHLSDFSVYNRFGQRVFFTRVTNDGWDGTFNGKIADLGTYFYLVNYVIGAKSYKLKGDVSLIR